MHDTTYMPAKNLQFAPAQTGLGRQLALLVMWLLACSCQAAPVVYEGTLSLGGTLTGSLKEGNVTDPAQWDLWRFSAPAGRMIELTVRRLSGAMDPLMGLWSGLEADTDDYANPPDLPGRISAGTATVADTGLSRDGLLSSNIGSGDDQLTPGVPGPFGDPRITLSLSVSGDYTVAVADWGWSLGFATPRDFSYSIGLRDITPVPLPGSMLLLLAGLLFLLGLGRRP